MHFRYIMIHPFRDSNGRIGRNIINMMLSRIGRNFVIPKSKKKEYISAMEEMRQGVYGEMGQEEYLRALSDEPLKLGECEIKYCERLAGIIEASNTLQRTAPKTQAQHHEVGPVKMGKESKPNKLNNEAVEF
jgi:Fic family protein